MHDAANDILNHANHHNFSRGTYGIVLGIVLFFNELSKTAINYSHVFIDTAEKHATVIASTPEMYIGSIPFAHVTTVGAFILIVFNIFRFLVDMHDRFKPTKKRGARKMPGDSTNPKIQKIINAAKAIVAPVKKPNGLIALISFLIAFAASAVVIICEAAPPSQHIERPIELGSLLIAAAFWIITFKHVRGPNASNNAR